MTENKPDKTALEEAMYLCSRREYCRYDIQLKLESWGMSQSDTEVILNNLTEQNFLNEDRYARAFVKDKFNHNKWGKIKISAHLKAKRISSPAIKNALDSIDDVLYRNTIASLIKTHRRSVRAKNQYDLKGKLLRFGLSRGFESSLLYELLNDLEE